MTASAMALAKPPRRAYGCVIMANELNLIQIRRRELRDDTARHRQAVADNDAEEAELEMAEKVILRLMGAIGHNTGAPVAATASEFSRGETVKRKPRVGRPLTEVIMEIMREWHGSGGMEPKQAVHTVRERWKPDADGTIVSTTFWRLMKQGHLVKDEGSSVYRLAEKEMAGDVPPPGSPSPAMAPAEGREAAPGGGT